MFEIWNLRNFDKKISSVKLVHIVIICRLKKQDKKIIMQ